MEITVPLTRLTRKNAPWNWSPDCDEAFNLLKQAFISAPVLHHFDPALPPIVETDASDYAIAGMFSLRTDDGEIRPVAFYAGTLSGAEQMYNGMNPLELNRITNYFDEVEPRAGIPARYVPQGTLSRGWRTQIGEPSHLLSPYET